MGRTLVARDIASFTSTVLFISTIAGCAGINGSSISQADSPRDTVQVDFDDRSSQQAAIPPNVIAAQRGSFGSSEQKALSLLHQSGVGVVRMDAAFAQVFVTRTPDWSVVDPAFRNLEAAGMQAIVELDFTPPWLMSSSRCSAGVPLPSDFHIWATLAAMYVHHVETNFPGVVRGYEIWNEPDNPVFNCNFPDATSRMTAYHQLYALVGPALRAQAAADGAQIRIGGPAVSRSNTAITTYIPNFVNDPEIAAYIDFVSYHEYPIGLVPSFTWSGASGLYYWTADPNVGVGARYKQIASIVRNGIQPNASRTPIFISEYNTTWWKNSSADCCRNSPTYSPLFNSVFISALLNTALEGFQAPAALSYYSSNSGDGDCLLASTGSDCLYEGGNLYSYPQLYTLNLIGSRTYLDLASGGNVAASVTSTNSNLVVSGFYTPNNDAVIIVNTGTAALSGVKVTFIRTGLAQPNATLFLLNDANQAISSRSIPLAATPEGYSFTISIPENSVVGISLR